LGSRIEQGNYLSQIEKDLAEKNEASPLGRDILVELIGRFANAGNIFESVCQYCNISHDRTIAQKATDPELHVAVNGYLEPQLINYVAENNGIDYVRLNKP